VLHRWRLVDEAIHLELELDRQLIGDEILEAVDRHAFS
jgi:hypothetical protein